MKVVVTPAKDPVHCESYSIEYNNANIENLKEKFMQLKGSYNIPFWHGHDLRTVYKISKVRFYIHEERWHVHFYQRRLDKYADNEERNNILDPIENVKISNRLQRPMFVEI
jgi:hypothetical protein